MDENNIYTPEETNTSPVNQQPIDLTPTYTPVSPYTYRPVQQPAPTPKPEEKPKRGFSFVTLIVCVLVCSLLATVISAAITMAALGNQSRDNSGNTSSQYIGGGNTNTTITNNTENFVEAVAQKVRPSVVAVVCTYSYNNGFFGGTGQADSEGSGVIYSADGYIITNKHVIEYAISRNGNVSVYLQNDPDTAHSATVVGYDSSMDLAVLKIDATNLPMAEIGDSDKLKVGQNAVAVGNPGGREFSGSVSVGYISGLDREVLIDSTKMRLIQTDTAINPGNSGGALVDNEGKLIGITNAKLVSEDFEGMGFAIPINEATKICDAIITGKDEPQPYIGVSIDSSYTASRLEQLGLPEGAVVSSVVEGGPAASAGVKANDIIVSASGKTVKNYDQLVSVIRQHKVGDKMPISVYRDGKYLNLTVTIGANG